MGRRLRRTQERSHELLKIIGWIFLGFLLFVFLLLFLPVHTRVRYDGAVQVWC